LFHLNFIKIDTNRLSNKTKLISSFCVCFQLTLLTRCPVGVLIRSSALIVFEAWFVKRKIRKSSKINREKRKKNITTNAMSKAKNFLKNLNV